MLEATQAAHSQNTRPDPVEAEVVIRRIASELASSGPSIDVRRAYAKLREAIEAATGAPFAPC